MHWKRLRIVDTLACRISLQLYRVRIILMLCLNSSVCECNFSTLSYRQHPKHTEEESLEETELRCLWHIGLHYFLPLMSRVESCWRQIVDTNGNSQSASPILNLFFLFEKLILYLKTDYASQPRLVLISTY